MFEEQTRKWWAVRKRDPRARLRLFCFPYAGGNASVFQEWHTSLPPDVEVCGIQLPGRAGRINEQPFTRISAVVPELAHALSGVLDRPCVFFGHSLGAILAFEVARYLRRLSLALPQHLVVSGRRAPQIPDLDPPDYVKNDDEFLSKIRELNGTPGEVLDNREIIQFLLPTIRADFELVETYEYANEEPLDCPITAFGGTADDETSGGQLEAWRHQTTKTFASHFIEGGHFFIHSAQQTLLRLLHKTLVLTGPFNP